MLKHSGMVPPEGETKAAMQEAIQLHSGCCDGNPYSPDKTAEQEKCSQHPPCNQLGSGRRDGGRNCVTV